MNRPRAADDFATIRARMEELRREREGTEATDNELQRDPSRHRARGERRTLEEISIGSRRARQPGSDTPLDRDRPWYARHE